MDLPLEFPYYPRIRTLALIVVTFALGGMFLEHLGETNTQGLIVHGIELSPENATRFYYVLTALAGIFVVLGLLGILELAFSDAKPVLRLTADEIILPPFLFRRDARHILYRDITGLSWKRVLTQKILIIHHGDRKRADINSAWFKDDASYEVVVQFIGNRVK
jgi:hypothetical protein